LVLLFVVIVVAGVGAVPVFLCVVDVVASVALVEAYIVLLAALVLVVFVVEDVVLPVLRFPRRLVALHVSLFFLLDIVVQQLYMTTTVVDDYDLGRLSMFHRLRSWGVGRWC
jgi:hypothetical protein